MACIRAVAFDFDDTLSDWPSAVGRAIRLLALEMPADSQAGFAERFLELAAERYPSRNPGPLFFEAQNVIAAVIADATRAIGLGDRFRALVQPVAFPDVAPALSGLATGYRLAVLSNNPYTPEGLRVLGLEAHFEKIIAIDESDPRAKPSHSAFEMLARELGLAPPEVLYVGDSFFHDVSPALAVGLAAAWIDRLGTEADLPDGAHRIASLAELAPLLARL